MKKKYILTSFIVLFGFQLAKSQVLISLLLGDKLNTEQLKFGLEGGMNVSSISNLETAKSVTNFNLGFYFDIALNENSNLYVHTGVLVKSTLGAKIDPYSLDDENLDAIFENAEVTRKLNYFNVPILGRYKFDNNVFMELGPMLGWMLNKSHDKFVENINSDDIEYKKKVREQYHKFDVGAQFGLGYQLKAMHGMCIAVKYYVGLMNINKEKSLGTQRNKAFYVLASIPIGAGEKAKAKNAAAKKKKEDKKLEKEKKKAFKNQSNV